MEKLSKSLVTKYILEMDWYAQNFDKENFDKVNQKLIDSNVQYEDKCTNEMLNRVLCMHIVDFVRGLNYQCDVDYADTALTNFTDLLTTWKSILDPDMLNEFNTFRFRFMNQKLLLCELARAAEVTDEPTKAKDINTTKITTYQKYVKSVDIAYSQESSELAQKHREAIVDIFGTSAASAQKVKEIFKSNSLVNFRKDLEKFLVDFMTMKLGSLSMPAGLLMNSSRKLNADLSPEKAMKNITAQDLEKKRKNFESNSNKNDPLNVDNNKSKKRSLIDAKKSATTVEPFDDIEDDEPVARIPPKKRAKVGAKEEFPAKLGGSSGSSELSEVKENKKRMRWTEEEELALRLGLERYPPSTISGITNHGNPVKYSGEIRYRWAEILKDADFAILVEKGRDNIALKDKFKNWVKKGSINDLGQTEKKKLKHSMNV